MAMASRIRLCCKWLSQCGLGRLSPLLLKTRAQLCVASQSKVRVVALGMGKSERIAKYQKKICNKRGMLRNKSM